MSLNATVTPPLCPWADSAWLFLLPLLSPSPASSSMKDSKELLCLIIAALTSGGFLFHDAATKMINPYETGDLISVAKLRQPHEEDKDEWGLGFDRNMLCVSGLGICLGYRNTDFIKWNQNWGLCYLLPWAELLREEVRECGAVQIDFIFLISQVNFIDSIS